MEATYVVKGMSCGGCAKSIERALSAALPAVRIDVSVDDDQVHVDGEHDASTVERAVENAGFEFAGEA